MLQETEIKHGWVQASETMIRYRKVFDAAKEEARTWCTEEQAEDHGQVAAWLDRSARLASAPSPSAWPASSCAASSRRAYLLLVSRSKIQAASA
jgi:hypothetical protein